MSDRAAQELLPKTVGYTTGGSKANHGALGAKGPRVAVRTPPPGSKKSFGRRELGCWRMTERIAGWGQRNKDRISGTPSR